MTRNLAVIGIALLASFHAFGQRDESEQYTRTARLVRQSLHGLSNYGVFDDLAFRVDGSTVTLSGSVVNAKLKSDAEIAVKRVDGVGVIFNEIEVLPQSTNDDALRSIVYRAIYKESPLAPRYSTRALSTIHIVVSDGEVTLEGFVDSQADKDVAGHAAEVREADKVINHLQIGK